MVALLNTPFRRDPSLSPIKTGVYCIRNKINGKVYVGSAARCFSGRWRTHRSSLNQGTHHSSHLQSAWNKYGGAVFEFIVIAACAPEWCLCLEQIQMQSFKSFDPDFGYNISPTAGSIRGVKYSVESRRKMSAWQIGRKMSQKSIEKRKVTINSRPRSEKEKAWSKKLPSVARSNPDAENRRRLSLKAYWKTPESKDHTKRRLIACGSPEACAKISAAMKGRKMSTEWRAKISASNKGRRHSPESRAKMSEAHKIRLKHTAYEQA